MPNCDPIHGPSNPSPEEQAASGVRRFGSVIGLNPEKEQYYRELHADAWPSVLERIRQSNIATTRSTPPRSRGRNTCSATSSMSAGISKRTCRRSPTIPRRSAGGRRLIPASSSSPPASPEPTGAKWKWSFWRSDGEGINLGEFDAWANSGQCGERGFRDDPAPENE